jgi:hypothetical protein
MEESMTHPNDNHLRAYLDGELDDAERVAAADHLASCADCRARLAEIEARAARLSTRLNMVSPAPAEAPSPQIALARFKSRLTQRKEPLTMKSIFSQRARPAWIGLAMIATLLFALTFAPIRAFASEFLKLFRVQQITILSIDTTRLSELNGDATLGKQIGQLFSDSVKVTRESSGPKVVADAAEASQVAGFNVRLWSESPSAPTLTVQDGTAFEFVVNRERAQAILNDAGRSDLALPESLDGATITVDIPAGVSAAYGDCPKPQTGEENERVNWRQLRSCVILAQIPSPSVTTPPNLDVAELAQIGLQFTGMTAEEARAFSTTVDWTSTLVVPLPRNGHEYTQVEVDGVTGNLIYRYTDDGVPAHYTLLWVKDGIVYALSGFDDADKGLTIANALK